MRPAQLTLNQTSMPLVSCPCVQQTNSGLVPVGMLPIGAPDVFGSGRRLTVDVMEIGALEAPAASERAPELRLRGLLPQGPVVLDGRSGYSAVLS